jgi:site-specific DNA-methyltransferase (cytosine-N4-specific)
MKTLLKDPEKFYSPKKRPSGHDISAGFGKDNGGAIPSNLLQIPNSESNSTYLAGCNALNIKQHPARFPAKLPEFFIQFLTDPGDVVADIFAGSNTTGQVAEALGRRWIAFDENLDYVASSALRFFSKDITEGDMQRMYDSIRRGESVNIDEYRNQRGLYFAADTF